MGYGLARVYTDTSEKVGKGGARQGRGKLGLWGVAWPESVWWSLSPFHPNSLYEQKTLLIIVYSGLIVCPLLR